MKDFIGSINPNFIRWLHMKSDSASDYLFKIVVALIVYLIVSSLMKKLEEILENNITINKFTKFIIEFFHYLIILSTLFLIIAQLVVVEVSAAALPKPTDFIKWIHGESNTVISSLVKIGLALFIFLIIYGALSKIIDIIQDYLYEKDIDKNLVKIFPKVIMYILVTFLIFAATIQLFIVGITSIPAMVIFVCICISIAVPESVLKAAHFTNNGFANIVIDLSYKAIGIMIVFSFVFMTYQGVVTFLDSGSRAQDITHCLTLSQKKIESKLETTFSESITAKDKIFSDSPDNISVKTDGSLNLIYMDGKRIGVNTSSNKYKFYNIAVNQPEVKALKETTYEFEGYTQALVGISGKSTKTYYYYNTMQNDCLAISVNNVTNRISDLTYFSDYSKIKNLLNTPD